MNDDLESMSNEEELDTTEEGDPTEADAKRLQLIEAHLEMVTAERDHQPGKANIVEQWKAIERILDSKHLDFTDDNLKEFSDLYGHEFINLLSKRNLEPEERKIFNLTLKVRLLNLAHAMLFEKTINEMSTRNADYLEKLNEKLYLENETALHHKTAELISTLEEHQDKAVKQARSVHMEAEAKKNELVEAVKAAEQLRVDIAEHKEKVLKGIGKALERNIHRILKPSITQILETERGRRKLIDQRTFKHLFIVFGASLFLFGMAIYNTIK